MSKCGQRGASDGQIDLLQAMIQDALFLSLFLFYYLQHRRPRHCTLLQQIQKGKSKEDQSQEKFPG